jgi:membrane associated rhomboid family serine protease
MEFENLPLVTVLLAFVNVAAWLAVLSLADPALWREAYLTYGFVPAQFNIAALPTSLFLHAGFSHLAGNVYFLVVFGRIIEGAWGAFRFTALYLSAGLIAGLAHWAVYPDSTLPLIGASGAIAALMGAVAVGFPAVQVNLLGFFGPFLAAGMGNVSVSAGVILTIWFTYQSLMFLGGTESSGVAWTAHVFGFIIGAIAGARLKKKEAVVDDF